MEAVNIGEIDAGARKDSVAPSQAHLYLETNPDQMRKTSFGAILALLLP
jgi:hypothetical protein